MSYIFENKGFNIKKEDDKRIKLTDERKEEIKYKYSLGLYSQRQLAAMYDVDRRTIQFIIFPERYERVKKQRAENGKDGRYRDKEATKRYREHKKQLYNEGRLITNE